MNRDEFEQIAEKNGYEHLKNLSVSDYNDVEYVYTFHPSIDEVNGKEQIVKLVGEFGMRMIADMLPTAKKAEHLEICISKTNQRLATLKERYERLKAGIDDEDTTDEQ